MYLFNCCVSVCVCVVSVGVCMSVCVRESLYSINLGSPPRIALLTAGYKGLFSLMSK